MKKSFWFWSLIVVGGLLVLGIVVGIPLTVQYIHWLPGSEGNGNWLGFWSSYLGIIASVIIAFLVTKFQIDTQNKNASESIFKPERPLFKILSVDCVTELSDQITKSYVPLGCEKLIHCFLREKKELRSLVIKNISDKSMIGVQCYVLYNDKSTAKYQIDRISEKKAIALVDFKSKKIDKVIIYFNTNLRELIRLTFKQGEMGYLEYLRNDKFIENKDKKFPTKNPEYKQYDEQYNLNNFAESQTINND